MKKTTRIEVGTYEGRIGYTAIYDDGSRQHHLFSPEVALDLANALITTVKNMRAGLPFEEIVIADHARVNYPVERIPTTESVSIGLTGGSDEATEKKKIH